LRQLPNAVATDLSLADHSAPAPDHQSEGQNGGKSDGVLKMLCHNMHLLSGKFIRSLFYSSFVLLASGVGAQCNSKT
jgi:hypothetical protein